ncbi:putative acyl-CoA dehydrogenase AidB [Fusarium austroafricanum]|uniref:Putative acyl-CoA dehydrogenase AidB n=1 Tax=Fusarium austroafricanum TaxID=2364996 RepID=A0A8H4KGC5_9HYPO|nr:putative acyl-CoA dehydrogenase AidB [Fusarium austroafricanum]
MEASGADKGFFQKPPVLNNQVHDDVTFQRCFKLFLPQHIIRQVQDELTALGNDVLSDQIFTWVADAEHNKPYLKGSGRDVFGQWKGDLVTGEGWRGLQNFGLSRGIVAAGYDTPYGPFARAYQFMRVQLWTPSCANVSCPSAMQDGAARLLQTHLRNPELSAKLTDEQRKIFENAFNHLTSRDLKNAWTSGQWMTERTGGSDVSLTETTAVHNPIPETQFASKAESIPVGPWSVNGFKWFSSATDSKMTVLLARTSKGGISAFMAPMYRHDANATTSTGLPNSNGNKLNGVRIQRLKNKSGTQPLPTAELVIENMRAWLIGQEGRGIQEITTVLTLTRVHSSVAAMGYLGRGLAIARAYARVREVGGGRGTRMKLTESSLHMRTLSNITSEYRGLMLLTTFTSYVLGVSEHNIPSDSNLSPALEALTPTAQHAALLVRVLTQLTKAYVCKTSVQLLFSCMEALGGVGYLLNDEQEYLNISRLHRDCAVLPIWEGTTDVLSTDFLRALKHPKSGQDTMNALEESLKRSVAFQGKAPRPEGWSPLDVWKSLRQRIECESLADLLGDAREVLWTVADLLVSVLLYVDVGSDGDQVSLDILYRFLEEKNVVARREKVPAKEQLAKDFAVVYGSPTNELSPKL